MRIATSTQKTVQLITIILRFHGTSAISLSDTWSSGSKKRLLSANRPPGRPACVSFCSVKWLPLLRSSTGAPRNRAEYHWRELGECNTTEENLAITSIVLRFRAKLRYPHLGEVVFADCSRLKATYRSQTVHRMNQSAFIPHTVACLVCRLN